MAQEIETAVNEALKRFGVQYAAAYIRETNREEWQCDQWAARFEKPGHLEEFDFFTGPGLRAKVTAGEKYRAKWGFPGLTQKDVQTRTIYGRRYLAELEKMRKPKAPEAARVLHSIILDSSASGQSFADWCSELGYDTDSRKALAVYEACQVNADKMRKIFNRAQIEELQTILQDY